MAFVHRAGHPPHLRDGVVNLPNRRERPTEPTIADRKEQPVLALLIFPAGALLGFGVCAYLAAQDTRRGTHPRSMGGPRLQRPLLIKYSFLAFAGVVGWASVGQLADATWYWNLLGIAGAVLGLVLFNLLDKRMTRHMG